MLFLDLAALAKTAALADTVGFLWPQLSITPSVGSFQQPGLLEIPALITKQLAWQVEEPTEVPSGPGALMQTYLISPQHQLH